MSPDTATTGAVARRDEGELTTFQRPAELVEISERLYCQVFAVGIWVSVGCAAFGMLTALLQRSDGQLGSVAVCGTVLAAVAVAATRPRELYRLLRRRPWGLLVPAGILGAGGLVVGPHNQLFVPIVGIIGVLGIATPLRVVVAAGLIPAGISVMQIIVAEGDAGAAVVPLAVIVPPVMFWLIMDRITSFALRLNQTLDQVASDAVPPLRVPDDGHHPGAGQDSDASQPRTEPLRRGLPAPRVIVVDGVRLTSRQLQVLLLACEGLRHAEIGACLGIAAQQVGRHLLEARRRTASESGPQLVAWARETGLVPRHARDAPSSD